ncbi:MAG: hypothetical protein ACXVA9_12980, partial [Bdellovibrionales bacterium]
SFNHPSPAAMRLPEIIAQTFNLVCVGFVEGTDTASISKLNTIKMRYKIFGTPSGPNFHRGIRRILAEKFNIKIEERPQEEKAKREANVTVRGSKAGDSAAVVQKSESGGTQNRGPVIISGKTPGGSDSVKQSGMGYKPDHSSNDGKAGDTTGNNGPIISSGPESSGMNSAMQAGNGAGTDNSVMQEGDGSAAKNSIMQEGGGAAEAMGAAQDGSPGGKDTGSVIQLGQDYEKPGQTATGGKRKKLKALTASETSRDAGGNLLFGENLDPNLPVPEAVPAPDLVGMLKKSLFDNEPEESTPQTLMEKAVENALTQICQRNPDIQPVALKMVTKIGVFPIDSAVIPGYLVIALEHAAAEDQKRFLRNCENTLRGSFESMGVAGKIESGFWLDVPQVPFEQWAQNAGTFNFKMNHLGHEVGVSYFQTEKPLTKPKLSKEKGMYVVGLADISTDEPVTFKAYLHLKENDKFYLYLRNGRQLQPEQKQRLEANEVSEVFMKTVDLENLRMFLAAAYLKDTIRNTGAA